MGSCLEKRQHLSNLPRLVTVAFPATRRELLRAKPLEFLDDRQDGFFPWTPERRDLIPCQRFEFDVLAACLFAVVVLACGW